MLTLLDESAWNVPEAGKRLVCPAREQHSAAGVLAQCAGAHARIRKADEAADSTGDASRLPVELAPAAGAKSPAAQDAHAGRIRVVSPRASSATAHELARADLLASLSGEVLTRLAARMQREEIEAGNAVVREGEPGERFYVVLAGMMTVSQDSLGPRRLLRPGDTFGEVALAMNMPRTASVRALTPTTVASCDRETFDEFIRPLFAE
jgi:cyclic nucleotide-binding protein